MTRVALFAFALLGAASVSAGPQIIVLSGDHTVIPDGGAPSSFGSQFKAVLVDGGSTSKEFSLGNIGDAPLTIPNGGMTISGTNASDFSVGSSGFTVPPGDAIVPSVQFDPSALGVRNAVLTINSNSVTSSSYVVKLRGLGVDSLPNLPNIKVDDVNGATAKQGKDGTTRVKSTFRITNIGGLDVDSGIAYVYYAPVYYIDDDAVPVAALPIKRLRGMNGDKFYGRNLKVKVNVGPLTKGGLFVRVLPLEPSALDSDYVGNQQLNPFNVLN